jgi:hypothetical protein
MDMVLLPVEVTLSLVEKRPSLLLCFCFSASASLLLLLLLCFCFCTGEGRREERREKRREDAEGGIGLSEAKLTAGLWALGRGRIQIQII